MQVWEYTCARHYSLGLLILVSEHCNVHDPTCFDTRHVESRQLQCSEVGESVTDNTVMAHQQIQL